MYFDWFAKLIPKELGRILASKAFTLWEKYNYYFFFKK